MSARRQQAGRFFLVSLAGLGLDLVLATALAAALGWPLWLCAATGFSAATVFNYLVNLRWTFRGTGAHGSLAGLGGYFLVVGVSLGIRVAAVAALERLLPAPLQIAPLILLLAAGLSFAANFVLARGLVFRPPRSASERGPGP
ncbi:GtrA family protein (plasmid) [Roseobacteraceae bacterium NS-SX3]